MTRKKWLSTSAVAALALATPTFAKAQAPATIEEIIVTAERRAQAVTDVPMSITALGGEQLEKQNFSTASDLARIVPGFSYTNTGANAPVYTLRGVGFNEISLATSPTVSVYVNEIALPFPAMTKGATLDLARVEVLKGPQGTLYGQNSTGGAINYIANRPTDRFEAGFKAGVGSYDAYNLEGYVSGPLVSNLNGRAALRLERADGWQRSVSRPGDRLGEVKSLAGRVILEWTPFDDGMVTLNVNGWRDQGETQAPQLSTILPIAPALLDARIAATPIVTGNNRDADWNPVDHSRDDSFIQASLRADWDITEDLKFTSISSYAFLEVDAFSDRDGVWLENSDYRIAGNILTYGQEFRLAGSALDRLNWILGVNYDEAKIKDNQDIYLSTSSNTRNTFGFALLRGDDWARQRSKTAAIFANGNFEVTDQVSLTAGIRYTEAKRDFAGCTATPTDPNANGAFRAISNFYRGRNGLPPIGPIPLGACLTLDAQFLPAVYQDTLKEDNISWRVAVDYQPNENTLVYASASKGYKSGSFPTLSASSYVQFFPVTQESVMAYEAGAKLTLAHRTLQLDGAVFYYDYQDKQLRGRNLDAVFGPLVALVNVPKSHVQGAEIAAQWLPFEGLTINAGAAYVKTEVDRYTGFNLFGQVQDFEGEPFNYSPKYQVNLDVDYRWPVNDGLYGFVGASESYRSKTTSDLGSSGIFDIRGYTLVDLRAGVESSEGKWRVTAFVRNATNKYYWTNVIRGLDTVTRITGMPRTYGVNLKMDF